MTAAWGNLLQGQGGLLSDVKAPPPNKSLDQPASAPRKRARSVGAETEAPQQPAKRHRDEKVIRDFLRKSAHNAPLEHFAFPDLEMRLRSIATKGLVHLFNSVAEAKANRRGSSRGGRSSRGGSSVGGSDAGTLGPYARPDSTVGGTSVVEGSAAARSAATAASSRASSATRKDVRTCMFESSVDFYTLNSYAVDGRGRRRSAELSC